MSKTILYRLFKAGRVPRKAEQQLAQENILLREEGIGGTVTLRQFRAPGKRYGFRRSWFSGSIVLTEQHFLAFQFATPVIGVAWQDARIIALQCSLEGTKTLCVKFDAATFNDDWSGDVEVRFRTPLAASILAIIEQQMTRGSDQAR